LLAKDFSKVLYFVKNVFCGSIGNNLSMCKVKHRGKIVYIWISPHPANSKTLLGVVVVVVASHPFSLLFSFMNSIYLDFKLTID